jgi:hypothetical protein
MHVLLPTGTSAAVRCDAGLMLRPLRMDAAVVTATDFGVTRLLLTGKVLCCAVLCCAVLCCAVLCCAVLCCAVLCCAVPAGCLFLVWKLQALRS